MILIGLGSNLPDADGNPPSVVLNRAIGALLDAGLAISAVSPIYETEPVPKSDQPWYANAVAAVDFDGEALDLLATLQSIEDSFGRIRRVRNEARVLDLDLLAYGDTVATLGDLTVPHPRMHERRFVLQPLVDIAPAWVHPALNETAAMMLAGLPMDYEIRKAE